MNENKKDPNSPKTPESIEEGVHSGFRTPEELIFRKEFDKSLNWFDKQIKLSLTLTIGVTIVFFIGFIAAIIAYFQILQSSVNEMRSVTQQYSDKNYTLLEHRIEELENKISTQSAR